jgi:hypothetical protein
MARILIRDSEGVIHLRLDYHHPYWNFFSRQTKMTIIEKINQKKMKNRDYQLNIWWTYGMPRDSVFQ